MFFFGGWTFLLLLPAIVLTLWAQYKVQATFSKFSRVASRRGLSGAAVARMILEGAGIEGVRVERVGGHLTDHYDPRAKVLRLSESTHDSYSVAALGVAAHEAGHAIQHDVAYAPLMMRSWLVPVANIGSMGGPWMFMIGLFLPSLRILMDLGILFFSAAVLFYLVTLPVEYNASNRALAVLERGGYLYADEMPMARAVLGAAALTYVASAAMAVMQLLRLILIRAGSRDE